MTISISSWTQLAAVGLTGDYQLTRSLLSTDGDYTGIGNNFIPIGVDAARFTGTFNGQGFVIHDLTINQAIDYVGLFGVVEGATIQNVGIVGGTITGNNGVGALVGYVETGTTITKCYATANVFGALYSGGLIGLLARSNISHCYAKGNITGTAAATGGLVGYAAMLSDPISDCYATGTILGTDYVGGLVGILDSGGYIQNSYSSGLTVTGGSWVGGITGIATSHNGTAIWIKNCFTTCTVNGTNPVNTGGLVGERLDSPYPGIQNVINSFYTDGTHSDPADKGTFESGGAAMFHGNAHTVYITSPIWDFTTPIWYVRSSDYPKFDAARTKCGLPLFFKQ